MKKFRSISLAALFVIALATMVIAKADYTATIQNNSTQDLGTVTLMQSSGNPVYVNVPGPGTFYATVSSTITFVSINGYYAPQGGQGVATLPNGKQVKFSLSGNIIVVTDQTIMN